MTTTFKYYGGGSDVSPTERELRARDGQTVEVTRELTDDERDPEVGRMFHVRFTDGHESDAFQEELTDDE